MAKALGATRALGIYSNGGADGGYAVPFTLDPTVIGTSSQTVNPLRQIARVENIVSKSWLGVTSAGARSAGLTRAPRWATTARPWISPEVTPTRVHGFVPFSIEAGQDWAALQSEVARMLPGRQGRRGGQRSSRATARATTRPASLPRSAPPAW